MRSSGLSVALLGALSSVALHALLLAPLLLAGGEHRRPVPDDFATAASGANGDSAMIVTLIEEPDTTGRRASNTLSVAALLVPPSLLTRADARELLEASAILDPEPGSEQRTGAAPVPGDAAITALYGRYLGQITARIERAWIRPRTPVEAGLFACRLRITQDRRGAVQDIKLGQCNGDASWKLSLVSAVESASPLPAPPDPKVFATVLTLGLNSKPYVADASTDGFEPDTPVATAAAAQPPSAEHLQRALEQLRLGRNHPQSGAIDLRIVGTPQETGQPENFAATPPAPPDGTDPRPL
jgi:hypothetical protein